MTKNKESGDLESIFLAGVKQVDPVTLIKNRVRIRDNVLSVMPEGSVPVGAAPEGTVREVGPFDFNLDTFDRIIVTGAGKATAKMAKAVEELLKDRTLSGTIVVKYGHTEHLKRIQTIEAGHPVPDENSVRAAGKIKEIAADADEKTLVINLISGGGSALLASPTDPTPAASGRGLTLEDLQKTTGRLLASGATINEMNCVRKHLSSIKGGRLAALIHPATQLNLILSDVIGDRLDVIASGPTTYDDTTYEEALQVLEKYGLEKEVSVNVRAVLQAGKDGLLPETPKKGDPVFDRVHNMIIGSNYTALTAARRRAKVLGYNTVLLSSRIIGEAREVAKFWAGIAKDEACREILTRKPACIIGGGETTVTLTGNGKGGRSQELALSFLIQFLDEEDAQKRGVYFLSASTDGNDGPTDAAGAYVYTEQIHRQTPFDKAEQYLENSDSYTFFEKAGSLFKTGPTNTNVCDLQVLIVV